MNTTILLLTAGIELGLWIGYHHREIEEWLREGRAMVLGFAEAIGRSR